MSDFEQQSEETASSTGGTFGAWLKSQRLAKKVPLEEIAAVTKIHIRQLKNLEDGWPQGTMPAVTFLRGFSVSYAKHIGLNESELIEKFNQHALEFKVQDAEVKSTPPQTYTSNSGKPLRFGSYSERKETLSISHWFSTKRIVYGVLVVLGFVLLIFLMKLGRHSNEVVQLAPSQPSVEVGPQPQQASIFEKAGQVGSAALFAGNPPFDVTLIAVGDVWVNLKVDENSMENIKLTKEASRKITFNRKVKLTISDPNQLKFSVGGKNYRMAVSSGTDVTLNLPEQTSKLQPKD